VFPDLDILKLHIGATAAEDEEELGAVLVALSPPQHIVGSVQHPWHVITASHAEAEFPDPSHPGNITNLIL
jgi:hypothetical protein